MLIDQLETDNLKDKISDLTVSYPITKWDLGASISEDNSVQVDKGEPKSMKSSQRTSITLRVWNHDGLVGITSSSDLTDDGLRKAIEGAYQASLYGNPNEIPNFSALCNSPLKDIKRPIFNNIGINFLYNKLKYAEKELLCKHTSFTSIPYNALAESNYRRIYLNSSGSTRDIRRSQASIYLYVRAEQPTKKPRKNQCFFDVFQGQRFCMNL